MSSSVLINPYKKQSEEQQCRTIIASVGEKDWERVFLRAPHRGLQDALFGSLFKRFVEITDTLNLPDHYDPATRSVYADTIRRITLP